MVISNYKLDKLSSSLADNIINSKTDPFEQQRVICQGKSMEQYLNKTIADQETIAANINYRFPRNSINDIISLSDKNRDVTRLDPKIMVWDIYFLLPKLIDKDCYKPLNDYINADISSKKFRQYQLSRQIASVFDFYLGYRGDWLESWQRFERITHRMNSNGNLDLGPHELWQSDLWRRLTIERGGTEGDRIIFKRASVILEECKDKIADKLPKKLSIFAISNMPQDYIDFFSILKQKIELDFYYIMPCIEYWGDSNRIAAVIENEGNRLLASWGKLGRDFLKLLLDADFELSQSVFIPEQSDNATLLTSLQHDILHDSSLDETRLKKIKTADKSIIINSCYSRMREIEVLHDHIFNELNHSNCEFSDILVMAPNIEDYAPYIKAIFKQNAITNSQESNQSSFIPFNISDCSTIFSSIDSEIFMKILNLPKGKMTSEDLFDIISSEPVANKFNFSKDDIEKMYDLISNAKISWGENNEHRKDVLKSEYNGFGTWEFGFKRMLMGYAFDSEGTVGENVLPLNNSDGIVIGKLILVCKKLFKICDDMSECYSYEDWCNKIFHPIIKEFFELTDNKNEQINPLSTAISSFRHACSKSNHNDEIFSLDVAKAAIEFELSDEASSTSSFFRGGVTFCQLLPMRNIPFKNICIIGMNDSEFPRINKKCGFNLAEKEYRIGDKVLRDEDRYIFLETLLAAKEKFYISYIGKSNSNNEILPPSVLVDELLDYLEESTGIKKNEYVTEHPLHGFNERYFKKDNENFYSYSKTYFKAAESYRDSKRDSVNELFCPKELDLSSDMRNEFSFEEFVKFFLCPAQFFLKYRFNIDLYEEKFKPLVTSEPFELNTLESYNLKDELLVHKIEKKDFDIEQNLKTSGGLPSGVRGDDIIQKADEIAEQLDEAVSELGEKCSNPKEYKLDFESKGFKFTLTGSFDNIFENEQEKVQAFFRPAKIKNKDKIKAYVWHQLAMYKDLGITKTILIGLDGDLNIYDCKSGFQSLVDVFVRGLCKPIPLFENSTPEYVKAITGNNDVDKALKKASEKWDKGYEDYGYDLEKYANLICFGEMPPSLNVDLKEAFIQLAVDFFGVVQKALESKNNG